MIRRKGRKHGTSLGPPTDVPKKAGSVNIEAIGRRASVVAYVFMLAAIGSIFALSWEGLTHFGEEVLGLRGWMVHIVPGSLDGAVIMFGCMAIVSMIAGENATSLRFMVQICAIGSAVFNGYQGWISADTEDRYFAGSYYACLSLLVALISHWFFRRIKRAARIEEGTLSVETVHFSVTEWTKFPVRRWKARTLALEYGIIDPRLAITLEASVNQRIDARVMRALEAYRNDETTPVYEFFRPDSSPEGGPDGGGKRRKRHRNVPESSDSVGAPHRSALESGPERPEALPEWPESGLPAPLPALESAPESPEPTPEAPEDGTEDVGKCAAPDSECFCSHRKELESLKAQSEASRYALESVGVDTGNNALEWLESHGRRVGQSTFYEVLRKMRIETGISEETPIRSLKSVPMPYNGEMRGQAYSRSSLARTKAVRFQCVMCNLPASVWDHCHDHGYIRGPLCGGCNVTERDFDAEHGRAHVSECPDCASVIAATS